MTILDPLRQKFLCELLMIFSQPPGRQNHYRIATVLDNAHRHNYKALELLDEALTQHLRPSSIKIPEDVKPYLQTESTKEAEALNDLSKASKCNICSKIFQKGVYGWRGYQGSGKCEGKSCTPKNLKVI
ncbi:hypothetical protein [Emticicia fontis]